MGQAGESFFDKARGVFRAASKHRWLALASAGGAALGCAAVIALVPERYEASARVYVDTQTVLKPLMADLTFQPDINQQVRMLARTLISRTNIEALLQTPGLQLADSDRAGRDALVARLMKQIRVLPTSADNLYEISYRGQTPGEAQRIVQATVDLFVHAGTGAKKRDSEDAGRFIEQQIGSYEIKLAEAETRLKEFKVRNFAISGVPNQDYFARVSALGDEVVKLRVALGAAEHERDAYRRELAFESTRPTAGRKAQDGEGSAFADAEQRLDIQRRQLAELLRRYTDAHPDVIGARRILEQLEAEAREARVNPSLRAARLAANPVYQQLRVSLAEAEARVASLRSQLAMQDARLEQVRALAGRVPQVEAELAQLNRDYEVIRKNHDVMVARRESASLGAKLDETSQLAEFQLIEPARAASSAVFPSRLHLALLGMLFSVAVGIAAAMLADRMRPTFDDLASLRRVAERAALGAVATIATPATIAARRSDALRFAAACVLLLASQATWVGWLAATRPDWP